MTLSYQKKQVCIEMAFPLFLVYLKDLRSQTLLEGRGTPELPRVQGSCKTGRGISSYEKQNPCKGNISYMGRKRFRARRARGQSQTLLNFPNRCRWFPTTCVRGTRLKRQTFLSANYWDRSETMSFLRNAWMGPPGFSKVQAANLFFTFFVPLATP